MKTINFSSEFKWDIAKILMTQSHAWWLFAEVWGASGGILIGLGENDMFKIEGVFAYSNAVQTRCWNKEIEHFVAGMLECWNVGMLECRIIRERLRLKTWLIKNQLERSYSLNAYVIHKSNWSICI